MNATPVAIRVRQSAGVLELEWPDGATTQIAQHALRDACRCAECVAQRGGGRSTTASGAVEISAIEAYGPGAVRVLFSDGHSRGIYPFAYMRELSLL